MVGISPDNLTKKVMRENPNAAISMQIMPFVLSATEDLDKSVEIFVILVVDNDLTSTCFHIGNLKFYLGSQ